MAGPSSIADAAPASRCQSRLGSGSSESALPRMLAKAEILDCNRSVVGPVIPNGHRFERREAARGMSRAADHPNARTTSAIRAEIARSDEPGGILARRVMGWARRPSASGASAAPRLLRHGPPCHPLSPRRPDLRPAEVPAASEPARHLAHPAREAPAPPSGPDALFTLRRGTRREGRLRDYDRGCIHIDIKQLPKTLYANRSLTAAVFGLRAGVR